MAYKNKIIIDYEISYFGFDQTILNCVSPLRGFSVQIERFQIKSNVLNLKSTLKVIFLSYSGVLFSK